MPLSPGLAIFQSISYNESMKNKDKRVFLSVWYSIMLSLIMPLNLLILFRGFCLIRLHVFKPFITLYLLLAGCYLLTLFVLGVLNIRHSFLLCKKGMLTPAARHMRIHKFGLIIFFVVNFFSYLLLFGGGSFLLLVASRGIVILTAIFTLPPLLLIICAIVFGTWLAILPGSFHSISVIRMLVRAGRLSKTAGILHGILQFIFVADVIDAFYLSAVCRKRN